MRKSKKILDLSISREVSHRIRTSLCELFSEPGHDYDQFSLTYQKDSFLSKYIDENTETDDVRRHNAITKWLSVELRNLRTNERLYTTDPVFRTENGPVYGQQFLRRVRKLITKVIGSAPPDDLLSRGSFSSGATTSLRRGIGTLCQKFTGSRDVTPKCWERLSGVLSDFEGWASHSPRLLQPRFVKGNSLFTVPKTPIIDRVACKEPDYNVFAQKAVGDFFRRRLLRKAGINLNDQSINRNLARIGSIDGSLATIDLSSASDSVTIALVASVLPPEWFLLLSDLRSPKTFIDGLSHTNEMFSSMGNGFTFELESLIFWAIAQTVRTTFTSGDPVKGRISVYGDDIIVPTRIARMLITVLSWCGFKVNVDKTFISGPFRESCGGHYHCGNDVSPFFLRRPVKDVSDLILLLNQYRSWIIRTEHDGVEMGWSCRNRFVRLWFELSRLVPSSLRGGCDIESRVQLVSEDKPQAELISVKRRALREEAELQTELYLSRLSVLDRRSDHSLLLETEGTSLVVPTTKWNVRRCKVKHYVFGLVKPLFLFEQLNVNRDS